MDSPNPSPTRIQPPTPPLPTQKNQTKTYNPKFIDYILAKDCIKDKGSGCYIMQLQITKNLLPKESRKVKQTPKEKPNLKRTKWMFKNTKKSM